VCRPRARAGRLMERVGSAFLPCESIKHSVLIAQEVIHKLQKKKKSLRFFLRPSLRARGILRWGRYG
jgi:hypothetical protein